LEGLLHRLHERGGKQKEMRIEGNRELPQKHQKKTQINLEKTKKKNYTEKNISKNYLSKQIPTYSLCNLSLVSPQPQPPRL